MTIGEFAASEHAQQRYWARSHVGWRSITGANPNDGHRAVAELQHAGLLAGIITQNVDGLHQSGGAHNVTELHGALDRVICLRCRGIGSRERLDARLRLANPDFLASISASGVVKPDGDIELDDSDVRRFVIVACESCDGPLKPDVVFFGENVPADRVADCYSMVQRCRLLLVLGSSLTVASGFRFARRASRLGIEVAIVNQGPTRADGLATLRLDVPLGKTLRAVADRVAG
jgi:NAD-dependent SIR2 family protein deacetylase